MAFATGLIPAPVYYLVPKIMPARKIPIAYGIIMAALNVSILAGPYFTGLSIDHFHIYESGFVVMGVFSLLACLCALLFKKQMANN